MRRKEEHLRICLEGGVEFDKSNGFENYQLEHQALPSLSLEEVSTATSFLGRDFRLPFFFEAITGGTAMACGINKNLARAAESLGLGMGLGSQRAMIENPDLTYTYQIRAEAPGIFLLGNIGAAQVLQYEPARLSDAVRLVQADGLAIHLNPVHEMIQEEGDRQWDGVLECIERLCRAADYPVVAKEVGCGLSAQAARALEQAGVSALDVAGAGGTCFAKIEQRRGSALAGAFTDWGLPTAEALRQCRRAVDIPLIASGGLRNGVECAKALAMGASLAGFALPVLKPAAAGHQPVIAVVERMAEELKRAMLLAGAADIEGLKRVRVLADGASDAPGRSRP